MFTLIIAIFLCLSTCCTTPIQTAQTSLDKHYITRFLFISDEFSEQQIKYIFQAAQNWECSINNIIAFIIKDKFSSKDNDFMYDVENSVIFQKVKSNHSKIVETDLRLQDEDELHLPHHTVGLFIKGNYEPSTILLVDDRLHADTFKPTVEHEIGHFLFLNHNDNMKSIMFKNINYGSKKITSEDLKAFCRIYECSYKELTPCNGEIE